MSPCSAAEMNASTARSSSEGDSSCAEDVGEAGGKRERKKSLALEKREESMVEGWVRVWVRVWGWVCEEGRRVARNVVGL